MSAHSYVTSARTLSLAVIALGYLGWQLGMFHNDRAGLFAKIVEYATIGWVDQQIRDGVAPFGDWNRASPLTRQNSPFGTLEISGPSGEVEFEEEPFRIQVNGPAGQFRTHAVFSKEEMEKRAEVWPAKGRELEAKFADLHVEPSAETVSKARLALYRRQLKVPGIDVVTFTSENATWVVSILCFLGLVVVRSRVAGILKARDAGNGEPWLILDARTRLEKAIATIWLAGIAVSGWLASFGPILLTIDLDRAGEIGPIYLAAATLMALSLMFASGWLGLKIVSDLLCLRQIRKRLETADQNGA